jgi:Bacterial Ig-like domain
MRRIWLVLAVAVAIATVLGSVGVASAQETTTGDTTTGDTTTQSNKFTLTDVHPNGGDSSVGPSTKVTATFNKNLRASTINDSSNNFRLRDLNTGHFVGANITVKDGVATLNPKNRLKSGHLYKAIIDAGSDGVRSQSGDTLQRVTAKNVHFSGGSASWKFRVR